jgi:hypothetical protein
VANRPGGHGLLDAFDSLLSLGHGFLPIWFSNQARVDVILAISSVDPPAPNPAFGTRVFANSISIGGMSIAVTWLWREARSAASFKIAPSVYYISLVLNVAPPHPCTFRPLVRPPPSEPLNGPRYPANCTFRTWCSGLKTRGLGLPPRAAGSYCSVRTYNPQNDRSLRARAEHPKRFRMLAR